MVRYSFPNKVVLVTGGSRGMGAAILEAFAAAGAVCVVNYFDDPDGQNRKRRRGDGRPSPRLHAPAVHLIEADVSRYESVERLMQRVADEAGGLDVLVNNAGVLRDRTVKKMTPDDWNAVLQNQPGRSVLLLEAGRRPPARRRPDRQRRLGRRPGRLPRPGQLRGSQGRRDRPDEGDGEGAGAPPHHRQRRGAGRDPHADAGGPQAGSAGGVREADSGRAASACRRTWPTRCCSSPPRRAPTSPARRCPSPEGWF